MTRCENVTTCCRYETTMPPRKPGCRHWHSCFTICLLEKPEDNKGKSDWPGYRDISNEFALEDSGQDKKNKGQAYSEFLNRGGEAKKEKPPIGVMPRNIFIQGRGIEICDAMKRFINAEQPIPRSWIEELLEDFGE